jgi:hypothetical protein
LLDYHLKVHDLMVAYVNQAMVWLNLNGDYNSMCCSWELRAYNSITRYFPREGEDNLYGLNFQVVINGREFPQ